MPVKLTISHIRTNSRLSGTERRLLQVGEEGWAYEDVAGVVPIERRKVFSAFETSVGAKIIHGSLARDDFFRRCEASDDRRCGFHLMGIDAFRDGSATAYVGEHFVDEGVVDAVFEEGGVCGAGGSRMCVGHDELEGGPDEVEVLCYD